jgi:asparagine synthase (glutamine-hydrolysing)
MTTFIPKNNNGFEWCHFDSVYFKGYFYNSDNKFYNETDAISVFNKITCEKDFMTILNSINGVFSVVIIKNSECFISCDITRIFPIFYTIKENSITLSDDINILKDKKNNSKFDEDSVYAFQGFGHTLGKNTLLKNIYQVQSSEYLIFEKNKMKSKGFYFSFGVKNYSNLPYNHYKTKVSQIIENTFIRLVNSLKGKTAVIPLSGGFDSRLIAVMLKKHNFKNVICFTYGKKNNIDMNLSQKVADSLNFKWYFIEHTDKLIEGYLNTDIFKKYCNSNFHYSSMLFLQEYFAVKYLKENNLIPANSVFIPGHDGGALGGGYLIKTIPLQLKSNKLPNSIYKKYAYAKSISTKKEKCLTEIETTLLDFNHNYKKLIFQSVYEDYVTKEITAKIIFNSSKVYEFFGYEHRFPFWDKELLDTFKYLPINYKINKKLFYDVLTDFFNLYNLNFQYEIRPSLLKIKYQNLKKILKPFFPYFILKNKLIKNDWLNSEKMVLEMENSLKTNNINYNAKIKTFNEMNIHWYLYFCKGLIKK